MPSNVVKNLAIEYNTDINTVEKYWRQAKKLADTSYTKKDDKYWGTVTTIVKNKLKTNEEEIIEQALTENVALLARMLLKQSAKRTAVGIGPEAVRKVMRLAVHKKLLSKAAMLIIGPLLGLTAFAQTHPVQTLFLISTNGLTFLSNISKQKQEALKRQAKIQHDAEKEKAVLWYKGTEAGSKVFQELQGRSKKIKIAYEHAVKANDVKEVKKILEEIRMYNEETGAYMDIAHQLYVYHNTNVTEMVYTKYLSGQVFIEEATLYV